MVTTLDELKHLDEENKKIDDENQLSNLVENA